MTKTLRERQVTLLTPHSDGKTYQLANDVVVELLKNPDVSPNVRLSAATGVITRYQTVMEKMDPLAELHALKDVELGAILAWAQQHLPKQQEHLGEGNVSSS